MRTQIVGSNRRKLSGQLPASRFQDTSHIVHSGYEYGKEHDISKDGTGNDPDDLLLRLRSVDDPPEQIAPSVCACSLLCARRAHGHTAFVLEAVITMVVLCARPRTCPMDASCPLSPL